MAIVVLTLDIGGGDTMKLSLDDTNPDAKVMVTKKASGLFHGRKEHVSNVAVNDEVCPIDGCGQSFPVQSIA